MTVTPQIAAIVLLLVPGLLGHAVFCAFTYTVKPTWSGRTVVALILSCLSYSIIAALRSLHIAGWAPFRWLPDPRAVIAAANEGLDRVLAPESLLCVAIACVLALFLGIALVKLQNHRLLFRYANRWGLTTKSGFASEWDSAMMCFARERWVMLLMDDGSAFTGWLQSHDISSTDRAIMLSNVREYDADGNHFVWPSDDLLFTNSLDKVKALRFIKEQDDHNAEETQGIEVSE